MPWDRVPNPLLWTAGWVLLNGCWLVAVVWILHRISQRLLTGSTSKARYWAAFSALGVLLCSMIVMGMVLWFNRPLNQWIEPTRVVLSDGRAFLPQVEVHPVLSRVWTVVQPSLPYITWAWAGLLTFGTAIVIRKWLKLRRRLKQSLPLPENVRESLTNICTELSRDRAPAIFINNTVLTPATAGWLRPVILLPEHTLRGLSPDHMKCILAHEMAHIRRSDYLMNLAQMLCDSILFFHPCARWLSEDIRQIREECCDDIAAAASGGVKKYGEALLALEDITPDPDISLSAAGGSLYDRIERLVMLRKEPSRETPIRLALSLVFTLVVCLGGAGVFGHVSQYAQRDALISSHPIGELVLREMGYYTEQPNPSIVPAMTRLSTSLNAKLPTQRSQVTELVDVLSQGAHGDELILAELPHLVLRSGQHDNLDGPLPVGHGSYWNFVARFMWTQSAQLEDPLEQQRWSRAAIALASQQKFSPEFLGMILNTDKPDKTLGWSTAKIDQIARLVAQQRNLNSRSIEGRTSGPSVIRIRPGTRFNQINSSANLQMLFAMEADETGQVDDALEQMRPFASNPVTAKLIQLLGARDKAVFVPGPVRN